MKSKIITDYNGLSVYQAGSIGLGVGTIRYYMDSNTQKFQLDSNEHGITRVVAIQILEDQTTFSSLVDLNYDQQQDKPASVSSYSINADILDSGDLQYSAGMVLYGQFTQVEISSGVVVLFCI